MKSIYEDLSWLPKIDEDFSKKLSNIKNANDFRKLASFSLNENQLNRLFNKFQSMQKDGNDFSSLESIKIGIVSNATTNLIVPSLVATAFRYGFALKVFEAEYNQVAQEAFSSINNFKDKELDFILVAIDYRGFPFIPSPGDDTFAKKNIYECTEYIKSVIESFKSKTKTQIIFQNIAPILENLSGSYEGRLVGTLSWLINCVNNNLNKLISEDTFLLDIASLSSFVGLENWHDPLLWNVAKLPFSQKYTPVYADYFLRIINAKLGKSRRCLISDLDNTLWGGVIGDDGLEGISIASGDATGEAYLNLQKTILDLRKRGVVLAISSKNEEHIARQPFKEHPDMLIKEDHIAVFQANWSDKASNIRLIAETLSLGLGSMVFLDDNPAERMQVRQELPEVAVIELPQDPSLFARTLIASGYFENITFTKEDLKRATFYQDNVKRAKILNQSSDMESYLKSLNMEINFSPFDLTGRVRIAQLINKSNQFNLTTKRYNEIDIKKFRRKS